MHRCPRTSFVTATPFVSLVILGLAPLSAGADLAFSSPEPPLPIGAFSTRVAAGDVTGNGLPDLLAANAGGANLSLLVNTGGSFAPAVHFGDADGEPRDLVVLDLDGDGARDLLIAQRGGEGALRVQMNLGLGDGQFGAPQTFGPQRNVFALRATDLSGNGEMDAVIVYTETVPPGMSGAFLAVYGNTGGGAFGESQSLHLTNAPVTYIVDAAVSDVDGDGAADLLGMHANAQMIAVFRNTSSGGELAFAPGEQLSVGPIIPLGVELADVDNDGDLDLVWANQNPGGLLVAKNDGSGAFSMPSVHLVSNVDHGFTAVSRPAVADLDGDGWLDLSIAGRVLLNQAGAGGFGPPQTVGGTAPALVNLAADVDEDGDADLLIVRFGVPTSPGMLLINDTAPQGVVGDLNGDGSVDVMDLLALLAAWGQCTNEANCPADLDGSGAVDVVDLLLLLTNWG